MRGISLIFLCLSFACYAYSAHNPNVLVRKWHSNGHSYYLRIQRAPFSATRHHLRFRTKHHRKVLLIDGRRAFGPRRATLPRTELTSFVLRQDGKRLKVPRTKWCDLFNMDFEGDSMFIDEAYGGGDERLVLSCGGRSNGVVREFFIVKSAVWTLDNEWPFVNGPYSGAPCPPFKSKTKPRGFGHVTSTTSYSGKDHGHRYAVSIKHCVFVPSDHALTKRKIEGLEDYNVLKVDGHEPIGTDFTMPKHEIRQFKVSLDGKQVPFPRSYWADCYELRTNRDLGEFNIWIGVERGKPYVWMRGTGSDGAGSYCMWWKVDARGHVRRWLQVGC